MAKEHIDTQDKSFIIELTKKETVDLIGLLTAQLADVTLVGNHPGACPQVRIRRNNVVEKEISFVVSPDESKVL